MLNIRAFIGDRPSDALINACNDLNIKVESINSDLIEEIKELTSIDQDCTEYDLIRIIFDAIQPRRNLNNHLAILFGKSKSMITKILSDRSRGNHELGRPRALSPEQESEVIQYIRNCQISGHCATFKQVTEFINSEILDNDDYVSPKYVQNNLVKKV